MSRKFSLDKSGDSYTEHPKETLDELENNSAIDLQNSIKGFIKNFPKYEGDETMNALQGANRLINTGKAATGRYEECQHFLETEESKGQFPHIMEDNKNEAKSMAIKALRLPGSVKHMEESPMDKLLAMDKQDAEKISLTRYEQSMLRNAVRKRQNTFNQRDKSFVKQQWNTRGANPREFKSQDEGTDDKPYPTNDSTLRNIGFFDQQGEGYIYPEQSAIIPRFSIRYSTYNDSSSKDKNTKTGDKDSTIVENYEALVM
ncbi:hypothetical protein G6F37_002546 [Rhizopus arrhizus]|nr:hypothetical protein G6F38_001046 [Rhizopus arrhizus]KAG1162004.1 hypothetical protein G6F37_002546 [Rhizopus arrhizus]